jgi:hypothetical protein
VFDRRRCSQVAQVISGILQIGRVWVAAGFSELAEFIQ